VPVKHVRVARVATLVCVSLALLVGCAQLLGLKADIAAGPCEIDDDCAPGQVCGSGTCQSADSAGGTSAGGSGTNGGGKAIGGSKTNGGSGSTDAGQGSGESTNGGSDATAGSDATGATNSGGTETSGAGENTGGAGPSPECKVGTDCVGVDNDCATRTCTDGKCGVDFEKQGTVLTKQTAGDCKKLICDGKGVVSSQTDDTDLPDDGNPCTLDMCKQGVVSHDSAPSSTACGASSQFKCDGKGACGNCTQNSDCGLDNLCATYTCTSNTCRSTFVATGQGNLANTAGDCKKNVCNGMGSPVAIADNTDLPVDTNPCTKDLCANGAPSNPPEGAGKSCGQYSTCNGASACVCSDPAANACPRLGAQCGNVTNGCGQVVTCTNTCNDGINTCNGAGNPNKCGCTPRPLICGALQCAGTISDGCGNTKDCSGDCQSLCPDNCQTKTCLFNGPDGGCYCSACNG